MHPEYEVYLTRDDFGYLHSDWLATGKQPDLTWPNYHAVFSCNRYGEIWPSIRKGYHEQEDRLSLPAERERMYRMLATLAQSVCPKGGRLFIEPDVNNGLPPRIIKLSDERRPVVAAIIRFCEAGDRRRLTFSWCEEQFPAIDYQRRNARTVCIDLSSM